MVMDAWTLRVGPVIFMKCFSQPLYLDQVDVLTAFSIIFSYLANMNEFMKLFSDQLFLYFPGIHPYVAVINIKVYLLNV